MKSKLYFGLILLQFIFINEIANAQSGDTACWVWVKSLSSTLGIYGNAIAIDPKGSGDIYVSGGFQGTVDFDPGPGTLTLSSGPLQNFGIFVSKFDESGNLVWARVMVGVAGGAGFAISTAIDPVDGAVYTTGHFNGTVDFDPGPNTFQLTAVQNNNVFISKLDGDGDFIWAVIMGGPEEDFGSLVIDPLGNNDVYITGQFQGTVDFDPGPEVFNLTSVGNHDIFISKLNRSGHFLWAKGIGGPGNEVSRTIVIDPNEGGKVYITGYFEGTVDFDPGTGTAHLIATVDKENFISKMDSSGSFVWAAQIGRVGSESDGSIALDPTGSGVFTTGSFQDTSDFNPGDSTFNLTSVGMSDIFISSLDSSGKFKWAKAMGGKSEDFGTSISIQPAEGGNVYTIGRFEGTADFNPGDDSTNLISQGAHDVFISNLNNSGDFNWAKVIKGANEDFSHSTAIDDNFLYLTGSFLSPSIWFDSFRISNINTSGADLFIAKLDLRTISVARIDSKVQQINIYPNPATNELNIVIDEDVYYDVGITIFNVLGEVVYFSPNEYIRQRKAIDISALPIGIYFIEFNMDGERVTRKIVKE